MSAGSRFPSFDLATLLPRPSTLYVAAAMIVAELLWLGWYIEFATVAVIDFTYFLYPLVWINVAVLAVWRTTPTPSGRRNRLIAGGIAVGYGLVLAYFGGILAPGNAFGIGPPADGLNFMLEAPPGYGPTVTYSGSLLWAAIVPYKLIGYAALTYLVYVTVLDAASSAIAGVLGFFSCISCSWPILASVFSGVTGASGAVTATGFGSSYPLSTAIFVVTVGLLYWRPSPW
jgi:hypothetical protein